MKKWNRFFILFAVVCLLGLLVLTASAARAGDIDHDDAVTAGDARLALRAAVGLETLTGDAWHVADADLSGGIEAADARLILRAAVGLETLTATSPHHYESWSVAKEATCAEPGEKTSVCSLCKEIGREAIPKNSAHKWDQGKITTAATCSAAGVKTYTCTVCKTTKTETIAKDKAKHTGDTELKNAVSATCAKEGYSGDICCKGCGAVLSAGSAIAKLTDHTWDGGKITKAATCAEAGVKTYTCSVCKTTKTETVAKNAANHAGGTELKNTVAATCAKAGYSGDTYCKGCGALLSAGKTVAKQTSHTWNGGKVTKAATCTAAGVKTYTCSVCNTTKTETINATGHSYGAWTNLNATQHQRICANDASHIEKANHTWNGGMVTKTPTCSETGIKTYTCTVCNATKTETVAKNAANHAGGTELRNAAAATCLAAGYSGDTYCKGCGAKIASGSAISKTAHSFNAGTVTKAATCSATGSKTVTCTVCGQTEVQSIPVDSSAHNYAWKNIGSGKCRQVCTYNSSHVGKTSAHTTQKVDGTAATCTTPGSKYYYACTKCGSKFSNVAGTQDADAASLVIPATGHSKVTETSANAATCTKDGNIAYWKCGVCGKYYSDRNLTKEISIESVSIPKLGHNMVDVVRQPTCENKGVAYSKCTRCDYKTADQSINALGHDYKLTGYANGAPPTCDRTTKFYGVYTCSRCGGKTNIQIERDPNNHPESAIQHDYSSVKEPSCTEDGYVISNSVVCTLCGELLAENVTEIIPKTEHQTRYIARKNATCTADGNIAYYVCSECNQYFTDEAGSRVLSASDIRLAATGHSFSGDKSDYFVVETTCTTPGYYYKVRSCANGCGAREVTFSNGTVKTYTASAFRSLLSNPQNMFEQAAPGHKPSIYFPAQAATCTLPARTEGWGCPVCQTPTSGMEWDGEPMGHNYTVSDSPLGTNAESFYCTVCKELRTDLLPAYNKLVNLIKSGPMKSENVVYFSKNGVSTDYTKLTVKGVISMIPGLKNSFRDEIRQNETSFSTGDTIPRIALYIRSSGKVSNLVDRDIAGLTVTKQNGLKISSLLDSSYGSSITVGSTTRDVEPYRQVQISGEVIAVTVKINTETYIPGQGIVGLGMDAESALEHFTGEDIRLHMDGFDDNGMHTEVEDDDTLSMTSEFKLKNIVSDGNATFYFRADTLEPLAAVYNVSIVSSQDIKMTIEMGSLNGSISADPVMTETDQMVYLFKAVKDLAS
ncbi:MAG: dockerin type I repeat-containing protein [Clostridia bacterium]|nr:dockerin type I repeat-containing protein [Clostridia bacterium]